MAIWFTLPSARPFAAARPYLDAWLERGYNLALWRDREDELSQHYQANAFHGRVLTVIPGEGEAYPGYAGVMNFMQRIVFGLDPSCNWIVTGGDDTLPDMTKLPEQIDLECQAHFATTLPSESAAFPYCPTGGVMQPTGDRFAGGSIDRICGSPWLGREFCRRMYGGAGPYWHEYRHMFVDEELQAVAVKLGVLWQRPDLTHYHDHFLRTPGTDIAEGPKPVPPHLVDANSREHWLKYQGIFQRRQAEGFPGHEPLSA